ncbi:uncharacterized protein CTRU02_210293 [Colletotrichum truncatum]|uniref:Uncharacterized protein n=1 Tax=Colletotrichum truncatum TaxID=5467 RepID=A0ACC3YXV6_COLTU|nr:uncharacterized protein CTRU02_11506 [Colletotrichum truncatum]KAF6785881.1 hypothetical protein CTRU02_11506 [Colletotrichum truncatum]
MLPHAQATACDIVITVTVTQTTLRSKTVCDHFSGSMRKAEREYGPNTSFQECEASTFGGASSFDNYDWRGRWASAGATGH